MTPFTQEELEAAGKILTAEFNFNEETDPLKALMVVSQKATEQQVLLTRQSRQIEELVKLAEEMICIHEHRRAPVSYAEAKGFRARLDSIRKGGA